MRRSIIIAQAMHAGQLAADFRRVLSGGTTRELRDNTVAELAIAQELHAIASILAGLCCVAWCQTKDADAAVLCCAVWCGVRPMLLCFAGVRPRTPMPLCCAGVRPRTPIPLCCAV